MGGNLAVQKNGKLQTRPLSSGPAVPKWMTILHALALDKRHDLDESVLLLWRLKLAKYPEAEIEQVLAEAAWDFFPSCDEVISLIARRVERSYLDRCTAEYEELQQTIEQERAEGKLVTPEEVERLNQELLEIARQKSIRIPNEPARSPRNVIALSQAKALKDLPPKKQPHPITDTSAEKEKVAKVAKVARKS